MYWPVVGGRLGIHRLLGDPELRVHPPAVAMVDTGPLGLAASLARRSRAEARQLV